MKTATHPTLNLLCREDGAVYIKNRWTFGTTTHYGYKQITVGRKSFRLHRVLWEAFNGPIPDGLQIDHINRNKLCNNLSNLRICTPSENCRNRKQSDFPNLKHGIHTYDVNAYQKARYRHNPEPQRERSRAYYLEHREEKLAYMRSYGKLYYRRKKAENQNKSQ